MIGHRFKSALQNLQNFFHVNKKLWILKKKKKKIPVHSKLIHILGGIGDMN